MTPTDPLVRFTLTKRRIKFLIRKFASFYFKRESLAYVLYGWPLPKITNQIRHHFVVFDYLKVSYFRREKFSWEQIFAKKVKFAKFFSREMLNKRAIREIRKHFFPRNVLKKLIPEIHKKLRWKLVLVKYRGNTTILWPREIREH